MVTRSEMRGIQGWFLKRLGCFSINQLSPSLSALRYAVKLIENKKQLVVFPEGKINKKGKGDNRDYGSQGDREKDKNIRTESEKNSGPRKG